MANPFTARKPWVAFLVALLLHPYIGMLYIGRLRLAGIYLLLEFVFLGAFVALYPDVLGGMDFKDAVSVFGLPLALFGTGHVTYLAWKRKPVLPVAWYGRWYAILGIPVAYVAVVFAISRLLFTPYYIPSEAMLPNFAKNDCIIVSRRAYDSHEPERGDVVAFRDAKNVVYIKRIIGLPHDHVAVRNGIVVLNGEPLPRTLLSGKDYVEKLPGSDRSYTIRKLYQAGGYFDQEGGYFDNVTEVTVPSENYYVLGDNRDNSMDSRSDQIGFVPRQNIVGPVIAKWFDGSTRHFVFRRVH